MDINKSIESIKDYFVTFNITEGVAYVLARFPQGWVIDGFFNKNSEETPIQIAPDKETGGYYFLTEMKNGTDILFEAVKDVVTLNQEMEEKKYLFGMKLNELKQLFAEKPLEELKKLTFTFNEPILIPKKGGKKDKKAPEKEVENTNEFVEDTYYMGKNSSYYTKDKELEKSKEKEVAE